MDPPAEMRKARPPRGVSPVMGQPDQRIRCVALYEPGNGEPIDTPAPGDIRATPYPTPLAPDSPDAAVTIDLPWPDSASHALLLLLHAQLAGLGDPAQLLPERSLLTGIVPHHLLALQIRDALPQATLADPRTDAQPMVRLAVAVYLNEPERDGSGILAMPQFPDAQASPTQRRSATQATPPPADGSQAGSASHTGVQPGIRFALASCQYPAGIIDGRFHRPAQQEPGDADIAPAERSLWRLARRFEQDPRLAFTVLAGDQIYADATAGLFDVRDLLDRLNFAYQRVRDHQGMDRLTRFGRGGIVALMDDHEVADNWEPLPTPDRHGGDEKEKLLPLARSAYVREQRNYWWPHSPLHPGGRLFEARAIGGHAFFLADTRTQRQGRSTANWRDAHIMDATQRGSLKDWITAQAAVDKPAFIVSPSILLPRPLRVQCRPAMAQTVDSWCGYPRSLHAVLAWAFEADARLLVFLSGDEHLACIARITVTCDQLPTRSVTLHSVHTSALYAPYPFANAIREDFAGDGQTGDNFSFSQTDDAGQTRHYHCHVNSAFPDTGDGFTLIDLNHSGGQWNLTVSFDGAARVQTSTMPL